MTRGEAINNICSIKNNADFEKAKKQINELFNIIEKQAELKALLQNRFESASDTIDKQGVMLNDFAKTINELEAKIAKLEGGVVAEFSEEVELDGDNDCLVMISDNFYLSAVDTKKISVGKQYTVTIKEKEIE